MHLQYQCAEDATCILEEADRVSRLLFGRTKGHTAAAAVNRSASG
jgi:hypothetical protein